MNRILALAIRHQASDLHLTVGSPPIIRVFGELEARGLPVLTASDITLMLQSMMGEQHLRELELTKDADFGIQYDLENRFRANLHQQREVGVDTHSFAAAIKGCLRQDPNVIVVGERDDVETIRTVLFAAGAAHKMRSMSHPIRDLYQQGLTDLCPLQPRNHNGVALRSIRPWSPRG